jgi:DNA polymerase
MVFIRDQRSANVFLPNGMALRYEDPEFQRGEITFKSRFGREKTYGGKLTENIIQALSRIVITDAITKIEKKYSHIKVALTIHDEVVCIAPKTDADATMRAIIETLCTPPTWAMDLPLAAEGGFADNYVK